ncbi:hypothetical protein EG328_011967 [Venturia inaequalis]|uniref:Uncharacterized protein n=2 Tax=Venturia inaequalis TaxID=5025 RepID=A0A8H3YJM9_VENIN|nr:hypothetical protein EG328_011967 [Venturia inaequalis]
MSQSHLFLQSLPFFVKPRTTTNMKLIIVLSWAAAVIALPTANPVANPIPAPIPQGHSGSNGGGPNPNPGSPGGGGATPKPPGGHGGGDR